MSYLSFVLLDNLACVSLVLNSVCCTLHNPACVSLVLNLDYLDLIIRFQRC